MVAEESEAGSQLQKEFCHVLDQRLLNIALHHIRFKWDKIKDVRIFHGLRRKLALWGGQSILEVRYLLRQHLPLVQAAFNLMNQHVARPPVLCGLLGVPDVLVRIFHLVHQGNVMIPGNLCKCRLHNFLIRKTQCKFCHILQISHRVSGGVRKGKLDIGGKILHELAAPCLVGIDDLTDGVIKDQQFPIDADCRTVLRCADLLLDRLNDMQIFVGIHQHGIFLPSHTISTQGFISVYQIFFLPSREEIRRSTTICTLQSSTAISSISSCSVTASARAS